MELKDLYRLLETGFALGLEPSDAEVGAMISTIEQLIADAPEELWPRVHEARYPLSLGANILVSASCNISGGEPKDFRPCYIRRYITKHSDRSLHGACIGPGQAARTLTSAGYSPAEVAERWRQSVAELLAVDVIGWHTSAYA